MHNMSLTSRQKIKIGIFQIRHILQSHVLHVPPVLDDDVLRSSQTPTEMYRRFHACGLSIAHLRASHTP